MEQGDKTRPNQEIFLAPTMGRLGNRCPVGFRNHYGPVAAMYFTSFPFLMSVCTVMILSLLCLCILLGILGTDNGLIRLF